ncbi:MAG: hypothetical protein ON057_000901 [Glomeribacter sp. 1016415]|nr:hypothetical protein [Glomeribacter sp. 1016415]
MNGIQTSSPAYAIKVMEQECNMPIITLLFAVAVLRNRPY